jgi:predicted nucleic acid-binding protein
MRVLLDTNIIIHRESPVVKHREIGVLFRWLDNLHYEKCVHHASVNEIKKLKPGNTLDAFSIKLDSYNLLSIPTSMNAVVQKVCGPIDQNENDRIDSLLVNELFAGRVDYLITEDKKILRKAELLGIGGRAFSIDAFLEKVTAENPGLAVYRVLAVRKELFAQVSLNDPFFDSFREDYPGFDKWFIKKGDEIAYVCRSENAITAFLYLKFEDESEAYPDIMPVFTRKRRMKIGTFKVILNGYKLGERFLKILFDNAIRYKVDEIYVTIFPKRMDQIRLINLLEEFGFVHYGEKFHHDGNELVYVRDMHKKFDAANPRITYPFFNRKGRSFIGSIYPEYHTNLFPDSILKTESPESYVENEPFRNAIRKIFISRSWNRDLRPGDNIVFYRTGGIYQGVISTVGVVENVVTGIRDEKSFIELCRKRSVFTDSELHDHWIYKPNSRPFIVNFLYTYSFPKRINLKNLIDLKVIKDVNSVPRGFEPITPSQFETILKETNTDESFVVN